MTVPHAGIRAPRDAPHQPVQAACQLSSTWGDRTTRGPYTVVPTQKQRATRHQATSQRCVLSHSCCCARQSAAGYSTQLIYRSAERRARLRATNAKLKSLATQAIIKLCISPTQATCDMLVQHTVGGGRTCRASRPLPGWCCACFSMPLSTTYTTPGTALHSTPAGVGTGAKQH